MCVCVCVWGEGCCVQLFVTPQTVECQASLSMEFSRQEYQIAICYCSNIAIAIVPSQPRDETGVSCVSCTGTQILYHCPTWEAQDLCVLKILAKCYYPLLPRGEETARAKLINSNFVSETMELLAIIPPTILLPESGSSMGLGLFCTDWSHHCIGNRKTTQPMQDTCLGRKWGDSWGDSWLEGHHSVYQLPWTLAPLVNYSPSRREEC